MGDGIWDKSGSRTSLHLNNLTLIEVNSIQSLFITTFAISSSFVHLHSYDKERGMF